jgi:hypothetical protein
MKKTLGRCAQARWASRCLLYLLAVPAVVLCLAPRTFAQASVDQPSAVAAASQPLPDKPAASSLSAGGPQIPTNTSKDTPEKKKDDRMFYVMPNYLTVDNEGDVEPISWKEKFSITARGAFDPYEFAIVGVVAGIRQADDSYPAFGQGMEGYAKRYGAGFADQVDGNLMVGAVYPSILKTDPRYFRMGEGGFAHRFGYAISRIFVTRKDSGGSVFNVSEFAGNATAIGISNVYYPAANRSVSSNVNNWGTQMGIDAFGNELKEFWPDVHHWIIKRRGGASDTTASYQPK